MPILLNLSISDAQRNIHHIVEVADEEEHRDATGSKQVHRVRENEGEMVGGVQTGVRDIIGCHVTLLSQGFAAEIEAVEGLGSAQRLPEACLVEVLLFVQALLDQVVFKL